MIKCETCFGQDEAVKFLNRLEEKGYNIIMSVISITQHSDYYTIFYKYNESTELRSYNL